MYVVFFITSKLWLKLKYIYAKQFIHGEQTNGNKYMQNCTIFQNFADPCLQNDPFFLISRIRATHWKNAPFRENGYEHDIRFGRECVCVCVGGLIMLMNAFINTSEQHVINT